MRSKKVLGLSILTAILLTGCAEKKMKVAINSISQPRYSSNLHRANINSSVYPSQNSVRRSTTHMPVIKSYIGRASWYGKDYHGRTTAYGEIYDMYKKTAAHKTLPPGTMVRVTDMMSGKSEIVRINDKGPFKSDRDIDLSFAAAKSLGIDKRGVADVRIEVLGKKREDYDLHMAQASTKIQGCIDPKYCQSDFTQKKMPNPLYPPTSNPIYDKAKKAGAYESRIEQKRRSSWINNPHQPQQDIGTIFHQIAIQVGAFRQYAGATRYADRYRLLDIRHPTKVLTFMDNAHPIYKVRILNFSNDMEAKRFILNHGLDHIGAFLVRN